MTDLQRFIELYQSFGIELTQEKYSNLIFVQINQTLENCAGHHIYRTVLTFDKNGKFINQSLYKN
jgi:hypothetical protein